MLCEYSKSDYFLEIMDLVCIFCRDRMPIRRIIQRNGDSWQPRVDVIIPCVKELVLASKRGIVPLQPGCRRIFALSSPGTDSGPTVETGKQVS